MDGNCQSNLLKLNKHHLCRKNIGEQMRKRLPQENNVSCAERHVSFFPSAQFLSLLMEKYSVKSALLGLHFLMCGVLLLL